MDDTQEQAFELYKTGTSLCITGPAGTGKSYLIQRIVCHAREEGKVVAVTAMTGTAAVLLGTNASTLHSWAGIGLGTLPVDELLMDIRSKRHVMEKWRTTQVLIVDEVSMLTADLFELLHTLGCFLRGRKSELFGGLQVILVGDFCQLPPIGPNVRFCFESDMFPNLKHIELSTIHRQNDSVWKTVLNEIRLGKCSKESHDILTSRMVASDPSSPIQPTKLYCKRGDVDSINKEEHDDLPGEEYVWKRTYTILPDGPFNKEAVERKLDMYEKNVQYYPILKLKVGDQVMLLKNMTALGLGNGSRGVVRSVVNGVPNVLFQNGVEVPIGPHAWELEFTRHQTIRIEQIPLRLAYAITIHKSQGMTLDCAEIDVGNGVFEAGQTYVALSRVKSLEGLYLTALDPRKIRIHPKVRDFLQNKDRNT